MTERKFLDTAYGLEDAAATRSFYDDWAASYDAEIAENGYATPRRCAEALGSHADNPAAPILDLGCGTGLSGIALRAAGFTTIDGADPSEKMLEAAKAREGVYRALHRIDPDRPLPFAPGAYEHIVAAGVINPGHAPPETMDQALAILPAGGCLVFSLNDHALAEPEFPAAVERIATAELAEVVFRQHGPHLPGIGLEATVYVLRKR